MAGDHVETVPAAAGSSDSEPTVTRIDIEEDYIPDLGEKQAEGFLQDGEEEVVSGKRVYILVHKSQWEFCKIGYYIQVLKILLR